MKPLPEHIVRFLEQPNPAVVATLRPDGSPHTAVTYYGFENGRAFITLDLIRRRVQWMRQDPRVSLTVIDKDDFYRHVTLYGRATIVPDEEIADYDRLVEHYRGPGRRALIRDRDRITAWIDIESWYSWDAVHARPDSVVAPLDRVE